MGPSRHDDSGPGDQEPTGSELASHGLLSALVALVQDGSGDGPIDVRYIRCDVCAGPTPHHTEVQIFSATAKDPSFVASPPEVVCAVCGSLHPRVIDDEPPRDIEVTCAARRVPPRPLDRIPFDRLPLERLSLARLRERLPSGRGALARTPLTRLRLDRQLARAVPARLRAVRWPGACAHRFHVPAAAPAVICPRCATTQPGPGGYGPSGS